MRAAEIRQILSQYLITPADARRSGIEFVMPGGEDEYPEPDAGKVASLAERRKRLLEE